MLVDENNAESVILNATRRQALADSIAWIGEGHPLAAGTEPAALLQALMISGGSGALADAAVRRVVQEAAASDFDTATVIFAPEWLPTPETFRHALEVLAGKTVDGTLATVTAQAALSAQREDPQTMHALCFVAGMTYRDLRERVSGIPSTAEGPWDRESVAAAFAVIDAVVRGDVTSEVEGTIPARPVELLLPLGSVKGWQDVEKFFSDGVPYELLLTQRVVGTAWGAHRNRTSSHVRYATAAALGAELERRGVEYLRTTAVGGDVQPSAVEELAGTGKQLGLVALSLTHRPVIGVAFSTARDGGTARANIGGLLMAREANIPVALVLTGPGWAGRGETVQLARAFNGRMFTDRSLSVLADDIAVLAQ
jgi:hypothetical protein